jgi:hypothetical protein
MTVTRLKRKGKKNRVVSKARIASIKALTAKPVLQNVDIEAIKEEFKKNLAEKDASPKAKKAVKPADEESVEKED